MPPSGTRCRSLKLQVPSSNSSHWIPWKTTIFPWCSIVSLWFSLRYRGIPCASVLHWYGEEHLMVGSRESFKDQDHHDPCPVQWHCQNLWPRSPVSFGKKTSGGLNPQPWCWCITVLSYICMMYLWCMSNWCHGFLQPLFCWVFSIVFSVYSVSCPSCLGRSWSDAALVERRDVSPSNMGFHRPTWHLKRINCHSGLTCFNQLIVVVFNMIEGLELSQISDETSKKVI